MTGSSTVRQRPTLTSWAERPIVAEVHAAMTTYLESSDEVVPIAGSGQPSVSVRAFNAAFRSGPGCGYLRDHYLGGSHARLEHRLYDQLGVENWFLHAAAPVAPPWFWLFAGPPGTGSPMHLDVMNSAAWNLLLEGEKVWRLESPAFGVERRSLPASLLAQPGVVTERRRMLVRQRPGDLLRVPSGWSHSVDNLAGSVAVTGNYVGAENAHLVRHYLERLGDRGALDQLDQLSRLHPPTRERAL